MLGGVYVIFRAVAVARVGEDRPADLHILPYLYMHRLNGAAVSADFERGVNIELALAYGFGVLVEYAHKLSDGAALLIDRDNAHAVLLALHVTGENCPVRRRDAYAAADGESVAFYING